MVAFIESFPEKRKHNLKVVINDNTSTLYSQKCPSFNILLPISKHQETGASRVVVWRHFLSQEHIHNAQKSGRMMTVNAQRLVRLERIVLQSVGTY